MTSREIADRALEQAKRAGEAAGVAIDANWDTPAYVCLLGRRISLSAKQNLC
jgi:hypothetical protein